MSYISANLAAQVSQQSSPVLPSGTSITITSEGDGNSVQDNNFDPSSQYFVYPKELFSGNHKTCFVMRAVQPNDYSGTTYNQIRGSFLTPDVKTPDQKNNVPQLEAMLMLYMPLLNHRVQHDVGGSKDGLFGHALGSLGRIAEGENIADEGKEFLGTIIGSATRGAVNAAEQNFLQSTGQVLADIAAYSYKGTNLRTQTFTFEFNPKNVADLKEVAGIYKTLMLLSHAKRGQSGAFERTSSEDEMNSNRIFKTLQVPPVWFLEERVIESDNHIAPKHIPEFKMGPCAIEAIDINMTPEQYWKTFKTADSASIVLTVTFKELIVRDQSIVQSELVQNTILNERRATSS